MQHPPLNQIGLFAGYDGSVLIVLGPLPKSTEKPLDRHRRLAAEDAWCTQLAMMCDVKERR